ncbi:hypothetical protein EJ05DRAFT_472747 [Pseudovirgaria hyperparasitica]|uniref:Uncharacterized protein n=1 Tax=Pseudovirgaria hyperparasitica TaxID=470096 RepID=A0A6A6WG25_9PEZI|nr:uncharacterized protein EJ05DRAFT_472747 [Pseudovirgaria hyperparasitica]KAF2761782.1 hypothetical protein EJ05DRAFT_472747 [Pseudovirgaria hyperparasitica]
MIYFHELDCTLSPQKINYFIHRQQEVAPYAHNHFLGAAGLSLLPYAIGWIHVHFDQT